MYSEILKQSLAFKTEVYSAVVGSRMYGMHTGSSDIDMKLAYLPTFKQMYENSYPHTDKPYDIANYSQVNMVTDPLHSYVKQALKGNPTGLDFFYSNDYITREDLKTQIDQLRSFLKASTDYNILHLTNALRGCALERYFKIKKRSLEGTEFRKEAAHAMGYLYLLQGYSKLYYYSPIDYSGKEDVYNWRHDPTRTVDNFETSFNGLVNKLEPLKEKFEIDNNNGSNLRNLKEITELCHELCLNMYLNEISK